MPPRCCPWITALFCLASLLSGCTTQTANQATVLAEGNAEILVRSSRLHKRCPIVAGSAVYQGEIMHAQVTLRSRVEEKIALEYRWSWYDRREQQLAVEGDSAWKTVFVEAEEEKEIRGHASGPLAVRGLFELRYHPSVNEK